MTDTIRKKDTLFRRAMAMANGLFFGHWLAFFKVFAVFYVPVLMIYYLFWDNSKLIDRIIDRYSLRTFHMIDDASYVVLLILFIMFLLAVILRIISADRGQKESVRSVYGKAGKMLKSYAWIKMICAFKVLGWTLLLILPGLYYAVLYSFAGMALLVDGKKGKEALELSRKMVKPNLKIYLVGSLNMLVLLLAVCIVYKFFFDRLAIFFLMNDINIMVDVIDNLSVIFVFLAGVYFLVFHYCMYKELKVRAGYNVTG